MKEIDNITILCLILFGIVFNALSISPTETLMVENLDPGIIQIVVASTNGSNNNSDSHERVSLDGVSLSYRPEINPQTGIVTLNMNITDQNTGKPLTHVD